MPQQQGEKALQILKKRSGKLTFVELKDGKIASVYNIAWGRDIGADYDHITTNISPSIDGKPIDTFYTSEIKQIESESGEILF